MSWVSLYPDPAGRLFPTHNRIHVDNRVKTNNQQTLINIPCVIQII